MKWAASSTKRPPCSKSTEAKLDQLTGGAHQLADALAQIRNEINGAVASSSGIVNTLQAMMDLMGGDKTIRQLENASQYVGRMRALGTI